MTWPLSSRTRSGRPRPEAGRLRHRDVHVDLEAGVLVDGREHRRGRDAIADPHRDVADHAGRRRRHPVVAELDPLLPDLLVDRLDLGLRRGERGGGLVVFHLRAGAGIEQRLGPVGLLPGQTEVGESRGALRLQRRHRGLLPLGVDLEQHGARRHAGARRDRDPPDDAVHLRLDRRRPARLDGADELARPLHGRVAERHRLDRRRRRPTRPCRPLPAAAARRGHRSGQQARRGPVASPAAPDIPSVSHRPHAPSRPEPPSILHGRSTIRCTTPGPSPRRYDACDAAWSFPS